MYVSLTVEVAVSAERLWAQLADIPSHTEWMRDAREIEVTSDRKQGAGTTARVRTRIGPLRTRDEMRFTVWKPPELMGVEHIGAVTGTGLFRIEPTGEGACTFTWEEELHFPWWLGGPLGELVGRPVVKAVWRRNLDRLVALAAR